MFVHKKEAIFCLYAQEFIYHHQLVELEGWLACLLCLEPDGEEIAGASTAGTFLLLTPLLSWVATTEIS